MLSATLQFILREVKNFKVILNHDTINKIKLKHVSLKIVIIYRRTAKNWIPFSQTRQ